MRDPKRIARFCIDLSIFWLRFAPDLRFFQLIDLIAGYREENISSDPFFWEEEDWLKAMKNYEEEMK